MTRRIDFNIEVRRPSLFPACRCGATTLLHRVLWLASVVSLPTTANAQDLLMLAGLTGTDDDSRPSYGWQIEINEAFTKHLNGSISWLNEGHVAGHHRDGGALQLWLKTPQWRDRVELAVGVGPYVYFDTQETSTAPGYDDYHGVGGILTTALSIDTRSPWSFNLRVNGIHAPGDQGTRSVLLGVGYRFDELLRRAEHAVDDVGSAASSRANEIQLFGGVVIANDLQSPQTGVVGVDFRSALTSWSDWSATWFYNRGGPDGRNNRIATQLWLIDNLRKQHLLVSAGLGPRVGLGASHLASGESAARLDGLFSLRVEWPWSQHSSVILTGHRAFTRDDLDQDTFTLGVGWQFR